MRTYIMADAKLPTIGKVNKPTLIVAGVAAVGAAIYAYEKKKKAAAAAATSSAASAYGYGYAYGGYGYGAGVGGIGTSGGAGYAGGYGYGGYGYGGTGGSSGGVNIPPPVNVPPAATDNVTWAQQAGSFLVSQGYNGSLVATTLNEYIHGQSVGGNENIVQAAISFLGDPPVPGANGFPPQIHTSGSGGQNPGGGVTGSKSAGPISNLQVTGYNATGVSFSWNPAPGATQGYHWALSGNGISKSGNTSNTHVSVTGLKKGVYNFSVQGLPGGPGNNIHTPSLKG
jgi:hypothetical protein